MQYKNTLISIMIALIFSMQLAVGQTDLRDEDMRIDRVDPAYGYEQERLLAIPAQDSKEYVWQDGDNSISLWEAENLVMERYDPDAPAEQSATIAKEDVLAEVDKLRVVKKQSWHQLGDDVFPVLVSSGGRWRALPGDVLVILMPDMGKADIDAFFERMNLNKVSKMDFAKNAYLIETEPGIVGLELSNKLAAMKEVDLASPNWWTVVEFR